MNGTVNAVLLAIRRHARGVQNGKALKHSTVNQHMDAIIALANIGLKAKGRPTSGPTKDHPARARKSIASDRKPKISGCGN